MTSTFKIGTRDHAGCGGSDLSGVGGDCTGGGACFVVFQVIFFLYSNDLLGEGLSSTLSISSL